MVPFFNFLLQIFVLLAEFGKVAARCLHHGKSASVSVSVSDAGYLFHPSWPHFPGFIGIPCTLKQCTASSVPTLGKFNHKSFTAFEHKNYLQAFHYHLPQ